MLARGYEGEVRGGLVWILVACWLEGMEGEVRVGLVWILVWRGGER